MFKDWCLLIPINNLGILPGHPLNDGDEIIYLPKCLLIFDGVKKSLLQIIEGIYRHQLAWIDWEIESAFFSLEVDFNEGDRSLLKTTSIVNC